MKNMKNYILIITALLSLASCNEKDGEADAYGNFEATYIIVSSETNGRILRFIPVEGSLIRKGDTIALIDSTLFHLQRAEIDATMKGIRARMTSIDAQNGILNQQIENIGVNVKRTENLLKDDAVPYKQLDDLMGQIAVLEKQIAANSSQKASVAAELKVLESKKAILKEQISRCIVRSPMDGTVIQKYSEEGELTGTGKPLAKIANLSVMKLKVYVSGAMIGKDQDRRGMHRKN
jgi:HlyD family secretion protein